MIDIDPGRKSVVNSVVAVAQLWMQRKLLWLLAAALLLGYCVQWRSRGREIHVNSIPSLPTPGRKLEIQSNGPSRLIDLAGAQTVNVTGNVDEFRKILAAGKLPNVRSLTLHPKISPDDLRALAALPHLEALQLLSTDGLVAADWSLLAKSLSLKQLRVIEFRDATWGSESIVWPPNLELVALEGSYQLSLERLKELGQLAHLHTLALRIDAQPATSSLPHEVVASLQRFPALQRLFLYEHPGLFPNMLALAQEELPHMAVRSWSYSKRRVNVAVWATFMLSAVYATVLALLSVQFVGPQSLLIPGYHQPHLRVALWIYCFVALSQVASLLSVACHVVGILGLVGTNLTFPWVLTRLLRFDPAIPGFVQMGLAWAVFTLSHICVGHAMLMWSAEADRLLRGGSPAWSWVAFLIGLYGAYDTVQWLIALPRVLEAKNRGGVPLKSFDPRAWKEWDARARAHAPLALVRGRTGGMSISARLDRILETSPWKLHRWQLIAAGQPTIGAKRFAVGVVLLLCIAGGWQAIQSEDGNGSNQLHRITMPLLGVAPVAALLIDLNKLYHRRGELAAELVRPICRSDWILAWFGIMCRSMLSYCFVTTLGSMAFALVFRQPIDSVDWVAHWGFVGACCLAVYGAGMALVTQRWGLWGMGFLGAITAMSFQLVLVMWAANVSPEAYAFGTRALWGVALCLVPIGIGTCYAAWRCWQRWEL